mmetsp:Transcript_29892/g.66117  ORF Transcript_29892/g.66117 Transcript_29892/m.66117 type:complete len:212 (-) Transcript_29892:329-964(-)
MHLRISSSLPITGSSLPSRAAWVRSRAYLARASYLPSGSWSVTLLVPRMSLTACSSLSLVRPSALYRLSPKRASSAMLSTRCSMLTNWSPHLALRSMERLTTPSRLRPSTCAESPDTLGCLRMNASVRSSRRVGSDPALTNTLRAMPLGCSSRALSRCSVSTICWLYSLAMSGAATMACHALSVNWFCVILFPADESVAAARTCRLCLPGR